MHHIRSAWSTITTSPRRIATTVAVIVGALVMGVGFSLTVAAVRGNPQLGQPPSAAASATVEPSASASFAPTHRPTTAPTPTATASPTPTPIATPSPTAAEITPSPSLTPADTPQPEPTPRVEGRCDDVTVDEAGTVSVNGQVVDDPWDAEYGEQMPMAVLRLGARATVTSDPDVCLWVDLPGVIVSGAVEICGEVATEGPGQPTIDEVEISDRMLDVNSYPLLDIADLVDVPACLHMQADANDVHVTLSLAICRSVQLAPDGDLTIIVGDLEWSFTPEYVYDDAGTLAIGKTVEAGLDIRNYKDDVIHSIEMGVWVSPGC